MMRGVNLCSDGICGGIVVALYRQHLCPQPKRFRNEKMINTGAKCVEIIELLLVAVVITANENEITYIYVLVVVVRSCTLLFCMCELFFFLLFAPSNALAGKLQ